MKTIPIPAELLEDLTKHLVVQDGSIEASMLAGRLIAARVAVDPTVAQIAQQPEGQRVWDVTGWDVGEVNEIVFQNRKGVEPAKLHIKVRDDRDEEVDGLSDDDSLYDGETPYIALVIGYDPPVSLEMKPVLDRRHLTPEGAQDPNFRDDLLDVPDPETIWGTPDPNTEQS